MVYGLTSWQVSAGPCWQKTGVITYSETLLYNRKKCSLVHMQVMVDPKLRAMMEKLYHDGVLSLQSSFFTTIPSPV